MMHINIYPRRGQQLATKFNLIGCKTKSMPFAYLGVPMGTTNLGINISSSSPRGLREG
jgi:hypothetical protein